MTALQTELGKKRIAAYLQKNAVRFKEDEDIFIETANPGHGPLADSGKSVGADFVVKTLAGKVLNSTLDTSFHMKGPKEFVVGAHFFPPLIESRLNQFRKGSVVRFYLPGVLINGVEPRSKELKIEDDLIFEIRILDVKDNPVGGKRPA